MLPSEELVGRRRPKDPPNYDVVLSGFLNGNGDPVGRGNPSERWLIPAFTKIRKEGLIRLGVRICLGGRPGPNDGIWYLKDGDAPITKARAASERVRRSRDEISEWNRDLMTAVRMVRARAEVLKIIRDRFGSDEEAESWMDNDPVPGMGGSTASDLIREGRKDAVIEYVTAADAGIFF